MTHARLFGKVVPRVDKEQAAIFLRAWISFD
jgi:hypothetical protein